MEDLLAASQEIQETGNTYKVPGDQHIMHLLASLAREADVEFGHKGLDMVGRAIVRFGEERGQRIARLVREASRPLTLMNFFIFGDLDVSGNEMTPELVDGELHIRVTRCRLADKLKELGLEKYAEHYCKYIDVALLNGYNPKLQLEVKSQLTRGGDCCHFIYRQPSGSVKTQG
jgi:hypothetical protein